MFCTKCGTFLQRYQELKTQKITEGDHDEKSNYWLIPVRNADSIQRLIVEETIWAYGINTPGRHSIKPYDWASFYLSRHGIVAHAQVMSYPEKMTHPRVKDPVQYPWVFQLGNISVYLDNPVKISLNIRKQLDAFQMDDPVSTKHAIDNWGWFVQNNKQITLHDFKILIQSE